MPLLLEDTEPQLRLEGWWIFAIRYRRVEWESMPPRANPSTAATGMAAAPEAEDAIAGADATKPAVEIPATEMQAVENRPQLGNGWTTRSDNCGLG